MTLTGDYQAAVKGDRPLLPSHLRAWRLYRGLTQSQLAARSGLAETTISAIESGTRDFTGKSLRLLAVALDTTAAERQGRYLERVGRHPRAGQNRRGTRGAARDSAPGKEVVQFPQHLIYTFK